MDEHDLLARVHTLVDEEHQLRERLGAGEISDTEEHSRLRALETQLDQCWDLLRQRRARREAGLDPEQAEAPTADELEAYGE
jgi:Protein of unknown function (DUF2630)